MAHILVIANRYPTAEKPYAGKFVERHKTLHEQVGLKVTVLSPCDSRRGVLRTPLKYIKMATFALPFVFDRSIDLVHALWELPSGLIGSLVSKALGVPLVLTSYGAFTRNFEQRSSLLRFLIRWVLRQADQLIAVGQSQRENIARIANIPYESIKCINMGVWIPPRRFSRTEARSLLDLDLQAPIIVFIGNLSEEKGADILVAAATLLPAELNARIFIGGGGPQRSLVEQLIRKQYLEDRIQLIGTVQPDDVAMWLAAADLCIVPSRTEAFGLVALEAMIAETCVIASSVGGLAETITDHVNGVLVPCEDYEAIASAIVTLLADKSLRQQIATEGRVRALQYDMRHQANAVLQLYQELLAQSRS